MRGYISLNGQFERLLFPFFHILPLPSYLLPSLPLLSFPYLSPSIYPLLSIAFYLSPSISFYLLPIYCLLSIPFYLLPSLPLPSPSPLHIKLKLYTNIKDIFRYQGKKANFKKTSKGLDLPEKDSEGVSGQTQSKKAKTSPRIRKTPNRIPTWIFSKIEGVRTFNRKTHLITHNTLPTSTSSYI